MSSYERRRRTAEIRAKRREDEIKKLVKDTKALYSEIRSLHNTIGTIMAMIVATQTHRGVTAGVTTTVTGIDIRSLASKERKVVEERLGKAIDEWMAKGLSKKQIEDNLKAITKKAEEEAAKAPTKLSRLAVITPIVAIILPVVMMAVTDMIKRIAEAEFRTFMREWEAKERGRREEALVRADEYISELYKSFETL